MFFFKVCFLLKNLSLTSENLEKVGMIFDKFAANYQSEYEIIRVTLINSPRGNTFILLWSVLYRTKDRPTFGQF